MDLKKHINAYGHRLHTTSRRQLLALLGGFVILGVIYIYTGSQRANAYAPIQTSYYMGQAIGGRQDDRAERRINEENERESGDFSSGVECLFLAIGCAVILKWARLRSIAHIASQGEIVKKNAA